MIERAFYKLPELAKRWSCSADDLLHLADVGQLQLTAALVLPDGIEDLPVRVFDFESDVAEPERMPIECLPSNDGDLFHLTGDGARQLARTGRTNASVLRTLDGKLLFIEWPPGTEFEVTTENVVVLAKDAAAARSAVQGAQSLAEASIHPRAEVTYLAIICALLELIRSPRPGRDSDAAVIRELIVKAASNLKCNTH